MSGTNKHKKNNVPAVVLLINTLKTQFLRMYSLAGKRLTMAPRVYGYRSWAILSLEKNLHIRMTCPISTFNVQPRNPKNSNDGHSHKQNDLLRINNGLSCNFFECFYYCTASDGSGFILSKSGISWRSKKTKIIHNKRNNIEVSQFAWLESLPGEL